MMPARIRQWLPEIHTVCAELDIYAHRLVIAAHLDVESMGGLLLTPQGPGGTGDRGHGHGLMQLDDRYHASFLSLVDDDGVPLWKKPLPSIRYALTRIWKPDLDFFSKYISAAALYEKEREKIPDAVLACTVAAYNAGRPRVVSAYCDPTKPTHYEAILAAVDGVTHHDGQGIGYVTRVFLARDKFLASAPASSPPHPKPEGVS